MRTLGLVSLISLAAACAPAGTGGTDGGGADGGSRKKIVDVSGQVQYDPSELSWRCLPTDWKTTESCVNGEAAQAGPVMLADGGTCLDNNGGSRGYPPCLNGDTVKVEDAIRALASLPPLKTVPLPADGKFAVPAVDTTNTTLALVGTVEDPSKALVYSGYGLGKPPFVDTCSFPQTMANGSCTKDKPVFVASKAFVQQLAIAMGQEFDAIMEQGVVIAHVTDLAGKGIAGAKIRHVYGAGTVNESTPELTEGVYYINDDLTGAVHIESADDASAVTSSSGLIVRLNAGSAQTYTATIGTAPNYTKFEQRLNGSRPGTAIEVFFAKCAASGESAMYQEGCTP